MSTHRSTVGCLALVLASAAQADPTPIPAGPPQRLDPARIAGARQLPGGGWERTTEWRPYTGAGSDAQDTPVYDSLDFGGGDWCQFGGGYYFKDDAGGIAHVPSVISNMTVPDAFAGIQSGRAEFMYYWTDSGTGYYIAIFTAEDVSTDCSLPAADNLYDGVAFGFDPIGSGFYYTDADTSADGLFYTMPKDGAGGFTMSISVEDCDFPPCFGPAQIYLFGTSNNGGSPGRPGESSDPTWADLDANGKFDPAFECVSLAGMGFCPDPPTVAVTFYTEDDQEVCYADCNGDDSLDLFDFLCFVGAFNSQDKYANCNGDDKHDLFDFFCFVNAFNDGCG